MIYAIYNITKAQWAFDETLNPREVDPAYPNDTILAGSLEFVGGHTTKDYLALWDVFVAYIATEGGFASLPNNAEKENACKVCAVLDGNGDIDSATIIGFYENTLSMSNADAIDRHMHERCVYQQRFIDVCCNRQQSYIVNGILGTYLEIGDINDFIAFAATEIHLYRKFGISGADYEGKEGIDDVVLSKNGFAVTGLEHRGYTLKTGKLIADLKTDLSGWLNNGIKPNYL